MTYTFNNYKTRLENHSNTISALGTSSNRMCFCDYTGTTQGSIGIRNVNHSANATDTAHVIIWCLYNVNENPG